MSQRQTREKQQEKQLSLRQRVALFQSTPSISGSYGGGHGNSGTRKQRTETVFPSRRVQIEDKDYKASSASGSASPKKTHTPLFAPPPDNCNGQDIHPRLLPSHCDALFISLHGLKEEELLLDCGLLLPGYSHKVHRLVVAAVSQKAEEWLRSGQTPFKEVDLCSLEESQCPLTPTGLKAVLNFAYFGEIDMMDESMEEILMACRCLGSERLAEVCRGEAPSCGSVERGRSLQVIRRLWERHVGCDVIIEVDSGECFPGKIRLEGLCGFMHHKQFISPTSPHPLE